MELLVLDICRTMRNETLSGPDMNAYAAVMRKFPYQTIIQCTESIVAGAERAEPVATTEPFVKAFWALYWGELVMFESRGVEAAMYEFGERLKQVERARRTPLTSAEVAEAAGSLTKHPERLVALVNELRVSGGYSETLNTLIREVHKSKPSPADVGKLRDARKVLLAALNADLRTNTIESNAGPKSGLKR